MLLLLLLLITDEEDITISELFSSLAFLMSAALSSSLGVYESANPLRTKCSSGVEIATAAARELGWLKSSERSALFSERWAFNGACTKAEQISLEGTRNVSRGDQLGGGKGPFNNPPADKFAFLAANNKEEEKSSNRLTVDERKMTDIYDEQNMGPYAATNSIDRDSVYTNEVAK